MLSGIFVKIDLRRFRFRRVFIYGEKHRAADFQGSMKSSHDAYELRVSIQIGVGVKTQVVRLAPYVARREIHAKDEVIELVLKLRFGHVSGEDARIVNILISPQRPRGLDHCRRYLKAMIEKCHRGQRHGMITGATADVRNPVRPWP